MVSDVGEGESMNQPSRLALRSRLTRVKSRRSLWRTTPPAMQSR